jgi:hypothetical protein
MKPIVTNIKRWISVFCKRRQSAQKPIKTETGKDVLNSNPKAFNVTHTNADRASSELNPKDDAEEVARDFYKLICSLADFVDELKLSAATASENLRPEQLCQTLIDKMELAEVQLIRQDTWDSTKQRAVRVAAENGLGLKVLSSTRTGVCHRGKIIRKEEVVITK